MTNTGRKFGFDILESDDVQELTDSDSEELSDAILI